MTNNLKYITDTEGYESARKQMADKYGKDSDKYRMWLYQNSRMKLDDDLYSNNKSVYDSLDLSDPVQKELYDLIQQKKAILKPYKKAYSFGYDYDIMPPESSPFKANLGAIESKIDKLKDVLQIKGDKSFFDNFDVITDARFSKQYNEE